eukprot:s1784_g10.t2
MGLVGFRRKALLRSLKPSERRKINAVCSLGFAFALTLLGADPPSLYPPDLFLDRPYGEEPIGKRFFALLHCLGIAYMVLGLNTVCDVYFAGSIDVLCDAWSLTPDVAGATWMAAGGSAPEFFTSMIGATIAQNDVGFGTIVGSAVFNVLFVIGLCGYVAKGNIELTWWPLFRDCSYYIFSLAVLATFTYNQIIEAWEAAILFSLYIGYVSFMFFNKPLNVWAYRKTGTPLNKELREYVEEMNKAKGKVEPEKVGSSTEKDTPEMQEPETREAKDNYMQSDTVVKKGTDNGKTDIELAKGDKDANADGDDDDEEDDDEPEDFMIMPEGILERVLWGLCLPVYIPLYYTLPWPSQGSKWFLATFFLSLLWIGGFSFLLIPIIVSSATFLAAATSIPDAVSSMAVARKGQADMAVSSSVGSNIFDILVGLPIPWLVKCGIESGNPDFRGVPIKSPYLMFYTCLLLGMVFGTVMSIKICGWKLQKALGACMAFLYFVFIVTTITFRTCGRSPDVFRAQHRRDGTLALEQEGPHPGSGSSTQNQLLLGIGIRSHFRPAVPQCRGHMSVSNAKSLLLVAGLSSQDPEELFAAATGLPRRLQIATTETTTTAGNFYPPPDLLLNQPYFEEPPGRKALAVLHVIGIAYMVLGLNTVCDVYFAGAIDLLCDAWDLTPDVAGATWMAAGGSAPEFFTSIIAVFNVLFVVGLCGWVAKGNIDLTWWPLFRDWASVGGGAASHSKAQGFRTQTEILAQDCSYYIISLAVLAAFVSDQYVKPWEAGILFGMYLIYVGFMLVNRPLNVWAYQMTGTPLNKELRDYERQKVSNKVEPMEAVEEAAPDNYMEPDKVVVKSTPLDDDDGKEPEDLLEGKLKDEKGMGKDWSASLRTTCILGREKDDDEPDDFMERPEGMFSTIIWVLSLPVYVPLYFTLPWPSKGSKLYMVTFGLALIWIGGFAFLLIPTIISGLTFLAAATSIPDAVSSMAVARKGQADMAVSSSVGSNIFDILVGLPIPWLLKSAIESNNPLFQGVFIRSPFLMFYTCLLLAMVFGTVVSIMLSKWKLNKFLGGCMAVLYVLFIIAGVVEMLKAKYGCLKGQRARVIGETQSLLQFEGGKTAPKAHEGSGWKWVIREEEESKQSAAEAQLAALQKAAALQAEQVAAHKAAELARAQAEAKAYAAAQEAMKAKVRHAGPDSEDGGSSSSSCPSESSLAAKKKKKKPQKDSDSGSGSTMSRKRKSTKKAKPKIWWVCKHQRVIEAPPLSQRIPLLPMSCADLNFQSSVLEHVRRAPRHAHAAAELTSQGQVCNIFTYGEVLAWARSIAEQILRDTGVPKTGEVLVALLMDRSALALAAVFGVWEAGGAYIPVPKDAPLQRRLTLCSDANLVLTDEADRELEDGLSLSSGPTVRLLERSFVPADLRSIRLQSEGIPDPSRTCMVIHTSGSTGRPKGVVCDHRCLWHSVSSFTTDLGENNCRRLLWKTPYQWRTAEYEMFPALCLAGCVFISPDGFQRQLTGVSDAIRDYDIRVMAGVPSVLTHMMEHLSSCSMLQHVVAVGEPLPRNLCSKALQASLHLTNYYGLTETGMTTWHCHAVPQSSTAPVGQPQPSVEITLCDEEGRSALEGEVMFGGIMFRCYLNMPELTAQKFRQVDGRAAFQSGDFGKWNGKELEVCGRIDNQVKLHGVRIELAEVEAALALFCREAAVVQAAEDEQTLVAFLVNCSVGAQDLPGKLAHQLPKYMVPLHYLEIHALPRLESQKVDRKNLRKQTKGLVTRAQAQDALAEGVHDMVQYLDSLGFARAVSLQTVQLYNLWDCLAVLGMANVILFHWFWCVLIEPRTYKFPAPGEPAENSVTMPKLPVPCWTLFTYRLATQDWAYGVFCFAAAAHTSSERSAFTQRDAAILTLYFYAGFLPMFLSLFFSEPWSSIVFHAETIQRWFLLSLIIGKAALVLDTWCGGGSFAALGLLAIAYISLPFCFENLCGYGGEYVLPTDWWPTCQACVLTPKVLICAVLYATAVRCNSTCSWLVLTARPGWGLCMFGASSVLSWLFSTQSAIENDDLSLSWPERSATRLASLLLIVIQTLSLASLCRPLARMNFFRWPARYLLGGYLLNVNFLDLLCLSPEVRRQLLLPLQDAGPVWSGVLTWMAMTIPVVFFMLLAAPAFQYLCIHLPQHAIMWAAAAVKTPSARAPPLQQPLLPESPLSSAFGKSDTKEKVARALKSKAKESSRSRKDLDSKARKKPKRRASLRDLLETQEVQEVTNILRIGHSCYHGLDEDGGFQSSIRHMLRCWTCKSDGFSEEHQTKVHIRGALTTRGPPFVMLVVPHWVRPMEGCPKTPISHAEKVESKYAWASGVITNGR